MDGYLGSGVGNKPALAESRQFRACVANEREHDGSRELMDGKKSIGQIQCKIKGLAALKIISDEADGKIPPQGGGEAMGGRDDRGGGGGKDRYNIGVSVHDVEFFNARRAPHANLHHACSRAPSRRRVRRRAEPGR